MNEIALAEAVLRIMVAVLVGGLIGAEREHREKGAGLRTMTLVSLGAALFTLYATGPDYRWLNPQLASGIVTGIGFIGAGVILHERGQVTGLTTAASVWLVAALGMAAGLGLYPLCALSTALALVVLWMLPRLDWLGKARTNYTYEVTAPYDPAQYDAFCQRFTAAGLRIAKHYLGRAGSDMVGVWHTLGRPEDHLRVMHLFVSDPGVKVFRVS